MYESLTGCIPKLDNSKYGDWCVDTEHEGTIDDPIQMPFVGYGRTVIELEQAIMEFVNLHAEMGLRSYREILEENGIEWEAKPMKNVDVSSLDGKTVMALLVGIIRADRFCEGVVLEFLENGSILSWLERLKEIDELDNI